jgi:hypothetical protein
MGSATPGLRAGLQNFGAQRGWASYILRATGILFSVVGSGDNVHLCLPICNACPVAGSLNGELNCKGIVIPSLCGPPRKLAARFAGRSPGLRFALALEIERHGGADQILQGRLIDFFAFVDVDRAPHVPVKARIE